MVHYIIIVLQISMIFYLYRAEKIILFRLKIYLDLKMFFGEARLFLLNMRVEREHEFL